MGLIVTPAYIDVSTRLSLAGMELLRLAGNITGTATKNTFPDLLYVDKTRTRLCEAVAALDRLERACRQERWTDAPLAPAKDG